MEPGLEWQWLREHPANLDRLIEHQRIRTTPLPGGDTCKAERLTMDDGSSLFAKSCPGSDPQLLASEARGLRWLGETGVPVPEVVIQTTTTEPMLLLQWLDSGPATSEAARQLGHDLAAMHAAGAPAFGADWPGFIGPLPMDNTPAPVWAEFYATQRVLPFLRLAVDRGAMSGVDAGVVEATLARDDTPVEPPARLHGDLWGGNVLWTGQGPAYLIDPAAHGGHRETDLALLALFGLPRLDTVLGAYQERTPLAPGWADRVGRHQLFPLAFHAARFGGGYGARAVAAARATA